ncbi:hypothetical protein JQX08_21875 [Pseudomonas sp. UL073]|uniref:Uncharacterized protein n=1 Tax=Zestomonas insulae TaxID=2809017 RepID=A0ABS2IK86_9GAMM|nr:hypothetical protein [Pseudomonas insulae]MBM7063377.1 hypothetical protein [Pseudomonas insulae]
MTNRDHYLYLLDRYGITQAKSATLISAVTQRPCAARTVRSWLNDPDKPSSKPGGPPDWALQGLLKAIEYIEAAMASRATVQDQARVGKA